jgi:hypothetical protein
MAASAAAHPAKASVSALGKSSRLEIFSQGAGEAGRSASENLFCSRSAGEIKRLTLPGNRAP